MDGRFVTGIAVFLVASVALGFLWAQMTATETRYSKAGCADPRITFAGQEETCAPLAPALGFLRAAVVVAGLAAAIGAALIVRGAGA